MLSLLLGIHDLKGYYYENFNLYSGVARQMISLGIMYYTNYVFSCFGSDKHLQYKITSREDKSLDEKER